MPFLSAASPPVSSGLNYDVVGVAGGFIFTITTDGNALELTAR